VGQSLAIETTLSGSWTLTAMRAALKQGYVVRVVYICVDNPELNIRRVRERVSHGGHDVPDDDVRRPYTRSLANIPEVLKIANRGFVFDNSLNEPRKMLETREGVMVWRATDLPSWVLSLIENRS
jgi:predicted ABC-type ATPase